MQKISLKAKAIAVVAAVIITVASAVTYVQVSKNSATATESGNENIADGNIEFQAVDINGNRVSISTAPINEDITLHIAITTSAASHTEEVYVIQMDNSNFVIDGLTNDGDSITLTSNGNTITITIDYNEDMSAYDLIVSGWDSGTTLSFDLGGHLTSEETTTVSMVTNSATHGGLIQATITGYGETTYLNTKTVNYTNLIVSSDGTVVADENGEALTESLVYVLRGDLDISNSANANIDSEITVTDVITIPSGINISDLETLLTYITVSGTSNVEYTAIQTDAGTGYIRQLQITYTLDSASEINNFLYSDNYTISIDIANLIIDYGTSITKGTSVDLTNSLTSEYTTDFEDITADESTVTTTIEKEEGPVYTYNKEITAVNGGTVTEYVKQGDTITYTLTIENSGIEAGTIDFVDYIPSNTTYVSSSVDEGSSVDVSDVTYVYNSNSNAVTGSATIGADGKLVLTLTVEVQSDGNRTISNTFFDKTVTIPQKLLESYTISKSADKTYFSASDTERTVTYTITVSNTGATTLTDQSITDTLPNGLTYISSSVGDNTDVTATYEDGTVTFSGITLEPGETKSFTITCELDETASGWILNVAYFNDAYSEVGISVASPFTLTKYVNEIEDGSRVQDPTTRIEANDGDEIEYTMTVKNNGSDYDLSSNSIVMEDIIPSTIIVDTESFYYTIGNDTTTYTANVTTESTSDGTKITWEIDTINGSTTFTAGTTITLHVFGTINVGEITTTTTIKNTATIDSLDLESTAYIDVISEDQLELEKYVYKIFDADGNLIYENTSGELETDQSKIPYVGENYTVVYRVNVTNTGKSTITELEITEKPDDTSQIGISTKYYDPTTKTVITGTDSSNDSTHIRINVYDSTDGTYLGTFTTKHIDYWGGGVTISTEDYSKRDWDYESWYSEGVYDNSGFSLESGETEVFEFSLVTTDTEFKQVTNTVTSDNVTATSETLYSLKTVNNLEKTVATTSKANVSTSQTYKDPLDLLLSDLDENYLIYKLTFNTKGYVNDELTITDVLNSNFSYVTDGVTGYDNLPIILITNEIDEWGTIVTLVNDEDGDTDETDSQDEYTVEVNGNTMTLKIKPSANRANNYESDFTIYYLVKSNGTITTDVLKAVNTASITYDDETISDTATVNVIKEKSYPSITKDYLGAYGASTVSMDGYNPSLNEHANENSRLVWTFTVSNDDATNAQTMTDYYIYDVLPTGYEYDDLYADDTYTGTVYYPSFTIVKSTGETKTYTAYDGTYIEPTHSTTVIDGETRNVVSWHFDTEEFNLEPGDYITFNISCRMPNDTGAAVIAVNDVYLVINGEYTTDENDDVTTYEGEEALHAQDYVLVGAANVTTATKTVEIYEEGDEGYDYASSDNSSENTIEGVAGEDITYTISIRNDSPQYAGKLMIIDRLPYVGDKYLSTESTTGRNSAFAITYKEIESIQIVDDAGDVIKTLSQGSDYTIDFSDYTDVISSDSSDWGKTDGTAVASWHSEYNSESDVNVRITFDESIQLEPDQSIVVTFKATIPDSTLIESADEDNTAWNNFAYTTTIINTKTGEEGDSLVAESSKVGVYVEPQETQVTVYKVWDDNSNYHQIRPTSIKVNLLKRVAGTEDEYVAVDGYQGITLSGDGDTWGTIITGLPLYEDGQLLEYTFEEVDENGNNEGNIDNYVTSESVETKDSDGYKVVTITNTEQTGNIEITKTVMSDGTDVSLQTDETFYFVIKDTTTNTYVLHDTNNNATSYVTINTLSAYSDLSSLLWTINPSVSQTLSIDNLILGRTYQIIETDSTGVEITSSNSKYTVTYNPQTNTVTDEDTTYEYGIINTLKLIDVTVTKVWEDDSNIRNVRPSEITLQLYANDVIVDGKSVTISVSDAVDGNTNIWEYTFENLRATDDYGNEISYRVVEVTDLSLNYTVTTGDPINNGEEITQTITNTEKTGEITVTKQVMNYGTDITSSAEGTYYFIVKQGNEGYVSQTGEVMVSLTNDCIFQIKTGSNSQTYSKVISNLTYGKTYTIIEVDENGNEIDETEVSFTITYENQSVSLTEGENYETTIINTLDTTDVTVYKKWEDSSNLHSVRPQSVTLQLYADGEIYGEEITLTSANVNQDTNTWEYTFENLPKYKEDGKTEIVYTVKETSSDVHYEKDESDLTVTNTEITGNVTITKKVLNDEDDITSSTNKTFYFVLEQYTDSSLDGYVKSNGEVVQDKTSAIFTITTGENGDTNYSKTISGLAVEKLYKVIEVDSEGNEITTNSLGYIVNYDANQTMSITSETTSASTIVTNILDTTNIKVIKKWDDNENENKVRPTSILVQLYADGTEYGDSVLLTEGNWEYEWTGVKKYKDNGTDKIEYTIKEFDATGNETINGYMQMAQSVETTDDGTTITLNNKELLGGLTISKYVLNTSGNVISTVPTEFAGPYYVTVVRDDTGNYIDADGNESGSVQTITLYAGESVTIQNIPLGTYTITETDIDGNPKSEDSQFTSRFEIIYSDSGRQVTVTDASDAVGIIIYNKLIETTKLEVTKVWEDNDNAHGIRPEKITVKLYTVDENGIKTDTGVYKEVTEDDIDSDGNWTITFEGLAKYDDNGNEIQYTADEETVPDNYTKQTVLNSDVVGTTYDSVTITNTEETNNLTVTKEYYNNENENITKTAEVTFYFIVEQSNNGQSEGYVNSQGILSSEKTVFSITTGPNVGENFSYTISGLTENRTYKVIETDSDGNEITSNNSNFNVSYVNQENTVSGSDITTTIKNTLKETSLKITKKWVDNEDHNLRSNITITLNADGSPYGTYELKESENWTITITGLPKYKDNGVDEIIYTVEEDTSNIPNYNQSSIEEVDDNEYVITNTEVTGTIKITKELYNTSGEKITDVSSKISDQEYYVTVKRNSTGNYLDKDGNEHVTAQIISLKANETVEIVGVALGEYTVTEVKADGSSVSSGFTITDTDGNKINLSVSYTNSTVELTKNNTEITTTVKNTITDTTSVTVNKVWDDKDKNLDYRPISLQVTLYANGEIATNTSGTKMQVTLTNDNATDDYNWSYTFSNLPVYDEYGNKIKYTISEENMKYSDESDGEVTYTSVINQDTYTITNTPSTSETVKLTITKDWQNEYDSSHRPDSIVFIIVRTDTNEEVRRVTLKSSDNWYYECNDLPKYNESLNVINYEVYELIPDNDDFKFYDVSGATLLNGEKVKQTSKTTSENTYDFKITNTFNVPDDEVSINVTKIWTNIISNYEDTIPDSITINVVGTVGETEVYSKQYVIDKATYANSSGTQWSYVIEGLAKYDSATGKEISYKVTEESINNFELANTTENYDGDEKYVTFTNEQQTGTLNISKKVLNASGTDISNTIKLRYYFTVTCTQNGTTYYVDASGNLHTNQTILSVATGDGVVATIYNLLLDKTYTVTETDKYGNTLTETNGDYIITNGKTDVTLTNENSSQTVEIENKLQSKKITVTKIWDDNNDEYGKRPDTLSFILYKTAGSVTTSETITVSIDDCEVDGNKWTFEITNLPVRNDEGTSISYKLVEDENGMDLYYLSSMASSASSTTKNESYTFTNKEIVGNYSLQLLKVDESGFAISGMTFKVNDEEYETDEIGRIVIIDQTTIFENSIEKITIEEVSDTSTVTNKKYVKLEEAVELYLKIERVENEYKVTGASFDGNAYSTQIENEVLLENGATTTIEAKITNNNITLQITNLEQQPDLSLNKFITAINDEQITSQIPSFTKKADGTYTYSKSNEVLEVEDNDLITYTIRVYNEGNINQYANIIADIVPQGLEYVEDNEVNIANGWTAIKNDDGTTTITTSILSKENGEGNLLKAYISESMDEPDYKDLQIVLKVVEPENSDRIVTNRAHIIEQVNKDGEDVGDIDSTPGSWIEGEDDQDEVSVKVKYFDLSLSKYITKVIVTKDGTETVEETGNTAENPNSQQSVTKVDLKNSEISGTSIKVEYGITVKNEGEIAGTATEITDYIPDGFTFEKADNEDWYEQNGNIVTNALKDTILQPGETATVKLVLRWNNSSSNIGVKVNTAEISEDYNESETPDIDSTPGNKDPEEDDISNAQLVITIKTGTAKDVIAIANTILAILGISILGIQAIRTKRKK